MTSEISAPLQASSVLALAPKVSMQALGADEGGVLLRLDSGEMYTVNDTTLDFLRRLDGTRTIASIVEEMVTFIDVDAAVLTADLIEIADELRRESLVMAGQ
jgi:hypothetical protein